MKKTSQLFSVLLIFGVSFTSSFPTHAQAGTNTESEYVNPDRDHEGTVDTGDLGMVVTAHPEASEIGADILRNGGNAIDAAGAVHFALNTVEPMMSGIGGGGFLMYYEAEEDQVHILDSRERAPAGATPDMFLDLSQAVTEPGQFLFGAIELNYEEDSQFQISDMTISDLDRSETLFSYHFNGDPGGKLPEAAFGTQLERGTILDDSGLLTFGEPYGTNRSSFLRLEPSMTESKNSELLVRFKLDDPGDDRRMRFWLRSDEFRAGSTYAVNGYGVEIDTKASELKLIRSKSGTSTTLETIPFDESATWQSLRFHLDESEIKARLWEEGETEPDSWMVETVIASALPFSERVESGLSVGIPGSLKGLETASEMWGTMPFSSLIEPSIDLAENGVSVNWVLAEAIKSNESKLKKSNGSEIFFNDEGEPLKEGEPLIQSDLAHTFSLIAEHGSDVFYNGEIGEAIASAVQNAGGSLTLDDFKGYEVSSHEPIWGSYKGYEIATMPPPSSGGLTMLQLLAMSEQLELTGQDVRSTSKYHLLTEMMRLAYADRAMYMGDPEYVDVPKQGLLHEDYIAKRVGQIDVTQASNEGKAGNPWKYEEGEPFASIKQPDDKKEGQTTHFTIADQWGNWVSYTTTIEQVFGSGIVPDGYGIVLNNELTDFDAIPGGVNQVEPGKRPLSSMTPTIVFKDEKPFMTAGSPGGATIISSVTHVLMNTLGYNMTLKDAIEEPRIYTNATAALRHESGIPDDVLQALVNMGHRLEERPVEIGNANSLLYDEKAGIYIGAADSSREGSAIGIQSEAPEKE
ncbi:gamma-glutamyltransferase [Shouchella patagoniensis]|uniref:gamma-glutamyltransferase n=1 Tax=Shouchella patagoniensis TaxID=228576 RepID=UPI000994E75E